MTVAERSGAVASFQGPKTVAEYGFGDAPELARLYGRERAQAIADLTEYEWQADPTRDPFVRFLNQAMGGRNEA